MANCSNGEPDVDAFVRVLKSDEPGRPLCGADFPCLASSTSLAPVCVRRGLVLERIGVRTSHAGMDSVHSQRTTIVRRVAIGVITLLCWFSLGSVCIHC